VLVSQLECALAEVEVYRSVMGSPQYDAVIIGAGPNGLAAAITLAREQLSTLVVEANATPGGGARSNALTLAGFTHDICSSVHPLGVA
jgi:phytoene dehydrogenase-like protein